MVATVLVSINLLVCAEYSNVFKTYGRSQKHSHCQVIHLLSLLVYDLIHLHLILIFISLEFCWHLFILFCCLFPFCNLPINIKNFFKQWFISKMLVVVIMSDEILVKIELKTFIFIFFAKVIVIVAIIFMSSR